MKFIKRLCVFSFLLLLSIQTSLAQPGCIGFKADFTFEKDSTSPNALTIKFTNTSTWTDSNTYYLWSYDDSSQKLIREESHTFTKTGTYNVCLYIYKLKGTDTVCRSTKYQNVTVDYDGCTVKAGYTYESEPGLTSQFQKNIIFTNTTVNADSCVMSYHWNYGDAFVGSSKAKTHKHSYIVSGNYTVCLVATCIKNNDTCVDTTCMPVKVNFCASEADFTYEIDSTKAANGIGDVIFTNTSHCLGDSVTYDWDYSDGSNSTVGATKHPHNYTTPGIYYACLTITCIKDNDTCIDTTCKNVAVDFCQLSPDFSYTINSNCFTYTFSSVSSANNHKWTFGDGSSSNSPNVKHIYTQKGEYTVCHIMTDTLQKGIICKDSICKTITVCKGLSISEFNSINALIYPSPVRNELKIETATISVLQFTITDLLGRKSKEGNFTENTTINVSDLASGIYYLELRDKNNIVFRQKISK